MFAPNGRALVAWTWQSFWGQREFYTNRAPQLGRAYYCSHSTAHVNEKQIPLCLHQWERWKEVLHGKERQPLRSDSSTSISSRELSVARSNLALSRSTSGSDRSSSVVSPTQCPCAACWRRGSDIEPVLEAAADEDVMAKSDALLLSQSAAKVSRRCTRVLMKWRVWAQPPQTERRNNLPGMSSTQ